MARKQIMQVSFGDVGDTLGERGCCIGGCCSIFWFIFTVLFLPSSIKQLGQKQIGIVKNTITGTVDLDNTYTPGRYWIGFWSDFITFPSTLNTIEFSDEVPEEGVEDLAVLETRDNEGRRVFMDVSVQYQLMPASLGKIYREMTINYEDIYISALRDGLAKVMNRVSVVQAWEDYAVLNSMMEASCQEILEVRHANCWGLQVWRVRVTPEYEGALIREQVRKQAQRTEKARLLSSQVRAETQVILAEYRKNVTVINATGAAQKYQIERDAQAKAEQSLIKAQSEILNIIRDTVKLDTSSGDAKDLTMDERQLLLYQRNMMMYEQHQAHMVYGAPGANVDLRQAQAAGSLTSRRLDDADGGRRLEESMGAFHEL
jgi:regulator of protease activity HflC (stomatin/prohibitin superfamily)